MTNPLKDVLGWIIVGTVLIVVGLGLGLVVGDLFGVEGNPDAATWIAIATLLLGVVTCLLVWVTFQQYRTAQRQLRAYVMIAHARVDLTLDKDGNGVHVGAQIELNKFGETPGYEFQTWTGITIGAPADDSFDEFGEPKQNSIIAPTETMLAPSDSFHIPAGDLAAIRSGKQVIYVWGYAQFTDAFDKRLRFVFRNEATGRERRLEIRPGVHVNGWDLTPAVTQERP